MRLRNKLVHRRLLGLGSVLLLALMIVALGFYLEQYNDLKQKVGNNGRQKLTELSPMLALATQENQNTIAQQATMAASLQDTTVPLGCSSVPYSDPLVGVDKFMMREEKTKTGDYWYLGRIIGYKEQKRGSCTDSIVELEKKVGGKLVSYSVILPSQMVGRGALGDILPKILGYKVGKRVELKIRYEVVEGRSLKAVLWNVENFLIN